MKHERNTPLRIKHISIRNYKGVDKLDIEFPSPRLLDDPDIFVMGSCNGLGKTSVIECCALLLLIPMLQNKQFRTEGHHSIMDVGDLLVRAGEKFAEISGAIVLGNEATAVKMRIDDQGGVKFSGENPKLLERMGENRALDSDVDVGDLIKAICGFTPNPVIENTILFFHSYRKVWEGNLEMGMLLRGKNPRHRNRVRLDDNLPVSTLKLQILHDLLRQAGLIEFDENDEQDEAINVLNNLMETYAECRTSKLCPLPDNTIRIMVEPMQNGESFPFDGLGSGQKEIISTLFLTWYHTRNRPSVVLIDAPELHLNAQWHRRFVKNLIEIAPQNQYIIATHSEHVMDCISADRRALLSSDQ